MNFDELCNFIKKRMVMSHIYQPVMIKTLVKSASQYSYDNTKGMVESVINAAIAKRIVYINLIYPVDV